MKKLLILPALLVSILSYSQSVTIAHTGLAPSAVMTVQVGETITFNYGSGGNHPMEEGWGTGEVSTQPFETQTVSSSIPSVTFTIDVAGTYYYHCGANPVNQANWGKIIVEGSGNETNGVEEVEKDEAQFSVFPNPSSTSLTINGFVESAEIYNILGVKVMDVTSAKVNVENLAAGAYFIKMADKTLKFIKK